MELFNKYKNKDIVTLTNYINSCINDNSAAIEPDELANILRGSSRNTFEELIKSILNQNFNGFDSKYPNADLFFTNRQNKTVPIRNNYIPIRPSVAEKAWLFYILNDPKSALFIDVDKRKKLVEILERDTTLPNIDACIDRRQLSSATSTNIYSLETADIFRCIIKAINEHKELVVTNQAFDGKIYKDQVIIPYKLEYSPQFDSFSLSAYPLDIKRPIKMNLLNLSNVSLGRDVADYDSFIISFEEQLLSTRVKTPITIEIKNDKNSYDRCSHKFASFDRVSYESKTGNLIMNIYYYRFQKDEILRNLMFLGPVVKITSPAEIKNEYIIMLKKALGKYEAED